MLKKFKGVKKGSITDPIKERQRELKKKIIIRGFGLSGKGVI